MGSVSGQLSPSPGTLYSCCTGRLCYILKSFLLKDLHVQYWLHILAFLVSGIRCSRYTFLHKSGDLLPGVSRLGMCGWGLHVPQCLEVIGGN